jgi:hypothetical protein
MRAGIASFACRHRGTRTIADAREMECGLHEIPLRTYATRGNAQHREMFRGTRDKFNGHLSAGFSILSGDACRPDLISGLSVIGLSR